MKTLRLWFEPDKTVPDFQRLHWEEAEVSFHDVLLNGIHPYDVPGAHPSGGDAILATVNNPICKFEELGQAGYCVDVGGLTANHYTPVSRIESALKRLQQTTYFVDSLSYLELTEIAEKRLQTQWSGPMVLDLAKRVHHGFPALRQFLKSKDKSMKLSGYQSLSNYDLSKVLSLEDFRGQDRTLLAYAIPTLNFRNQAWLGIITDDTGRLRLTKEISDFTLTQMENGFTTNGLAWRCSRKGATISLHPDMQAFRGNRETARTFAKKWRTDDGRLCFETSLSRVVEMVESGEATATFPTLDYTAARPGPKATVVHSLDRIDAFSVGDVLPRAYTVETLRGILREYGESMTGSKKVLLEKMAKLATSQYKRHLADLDRYFTKHRYVRASKEERCMAPFEILRDEPLLRNMILSMYILRHLRGNAILDATQENDAFSIDESAYALLNESVKVSGAYLSVK